MFVLLIFRMSYVCIPGYYKHVNDMFIYFGWGTRVQTEKPKETEWPTVWLVLACYVIWAIGTTVAATFWLPAGIVITTLAIAMQSSLQHEIIHGHPFANKTLNAALVFPALIIFIPYLRFRDTHLAHHQDACLTDPYDDPESNYLDPKVWDRLPVALRVLLACNNTLLGRLLFGPLVSQVMFFFSELRSMRDGDARVLAGWFWHLPALVPVFWWVVIVADMPVWAYLMSAYMGISILKIRTFLEHRAHDRTSCRTVVIEDRGPLAFIFLNNNLHVVHHMHPDTPWYHLPALYRDNRDRYLGRNEGYSYKSYGEVFRRYFFRAKDPVPHPLWPRD